MWVSRHLRYFNSTWWAWLMLKPIRCAIFMASFISKIETWCTQRSFLKSSKKTVSIHGTIRYTINSTSYTIQFQKLVSKPRRSIRWMELEGRCRCYTVYCGLSRVAWIQDTWLTNSQTVLYWWHNQYTLISGKQSSNRQSYDPFSSSFSNLPMD